MTTNKKPPVAYAARLARESVKLGLRVGGIVGGVALSAVWAACGRAMNGDARTDHESIRTSLDVPVLDDPDYVHNAFNHDEWLEGR